MEQNGISSDIDTPMEGDEECSKRELLTLEGLSEENKRLKLTVKEQEQLLKGKDNQIKRLQRILSNAKQMFRKDEWEYRKREWKRKKEELRRLSEEEDELCTTANDLISSLSAANYEIVSARMEEQKEKLRLKRRIRDLQNQELGHANYEKDEPGSDKGKQVVLKQLPIEVWEKILDLVPNPIDLWSCIHVCRMFDEILGKWKARYFLEQALPHLPKETLLECRLICKGWNGAVNNFLENHPSLRPHDAATSKPHDLDFINPVLEMDLGGGNVFGVAHPQGIPHLEDPKSPWIGNTGKNNRNPFIGRYVVFNFWREDLEDEERRPLKELELFDKMYTILKPFGTHIWYLSLMFPMYSVSEQMKQNIFQFLTADLFELVPNLRKLRLGGSLPTNLVVEPSEFFHPAPKLETIEVVVGSRNDDLPLLKALLIRDHAQLRMLVLNAATWNSVSHLSWPSLRELQLKNILSSANPSFSFVSLCEGRCPQLEKLGVDLGYYLKLEDLLVAINKIVPATRLNTLTLRLERMDSYLASNQEMETVSSSYAPLTLNTLELDISISSSSADFYNFLARYFPLVRNLNIFKTQSHMYVFNDTDQSEVKLCPQNECEGWSEAVGRYGYKEIVDVSEYACSGDMYSSYIWELLPRLEVLTFQRDVYTRFGYECFSSKRSKDATRDEEKNAEQDKIASQGNDEEAEAMEEDN